MSRNLFEELQSKKEGLVKMAAKAVEYGWITQERYQEIVTKLDNDTLTIGVIGQMKCGKSTFLNSLVFGDNVLPAATTPMTAALSVITYGEKQKIVAEFYNQDEWAEQKLQASRSLDDVQGNTMEESKIKAAKELMEKASKLGEELENYLGKTQEDDFENLEEYVGADGKYISITKSVTIYYPKDYLKGVEVVDTPGFNDPIVSREERTKAFLKKADVVLMMLYAGRPFDATDRDILFKNVRQCGIGKVIIGINKYDIPYENGETEEEIKQYVVEQIKAACDECKDNTLFEILKETEPIPLSAEMALLSEIPSTKVEADKALIFAWKRTKDLFEINSPSEFREKSHIDDLIAAIKQVIEVEKGKILFAKPLNAILAAGESKKEEIAKDLLESESLVQNLNTPDEELEDKLKGIRRVEKKLSSKVQYLADDLDSVFRPIVQKGCREMEDEVDKSCRTMTRIVDDWGRLANVDSIIPKLDGEKQNLLQRKLKYIVIDLNEEARNGIKKRVGDFLVDAEPYISKVMPDSTDINDFMKGFDSHLKMDIDGELFTFDNTDDGEDNYGWGDLAWDILDGALWGLPNLADRVLSHEDTKKQLKDAINSISRDFNPKVFLETIYQNKDSIVAYVNKAIFDTYIHPMQKQIEDILAKKGDKEKQLQEAKDKCQLLSIEKKKREQQLEELNILKNELHLN